MCQRICGVNLIKEVAPNEPGIKNRRKSFMLKEMHGLPIPKSAKHSLELDPIHGNHKWRDAMAKEIGTMRDFKVFEPIHKDRILTR